MWTTGRACLWLLVWSVAGALPGLAAQNGQPDPAQEARTIQIVATDAKGLPVADLRAEEIRISEAGKQRPAAFARFMNPEASSAASLSSGEFSNHADARLSSIVILVDLFNADYSDHGSAWEDLIRTLEKTEPADKVFLFFLAPDASVVPIHSWPPPGAPLSGSDNWTSQARNLLDQGLRAVKARKAVHGMDRNGMAQLTWQALTNLAVQYAALPGQKRLIWMTRGMPLTVSGPGNGPQPLALQNLLQQTSTEFRQLGISAYTVHAGDSLASLTGGRSFEGEAIGRAITEAEADARATYLVGFYTTAAGTDGKTHQFRILTTRKGVRILTANAYTAEPLDAIARNKLEMVESRSLDTPDIGLRASLALTNGTGHFQIYVDTSDLFVNRMGSSQNGGVLLAFIFYNMDGSQTATQPVSSRVNLSGDPSVAQRGESPVTVDLRLPAGTIRVRIVVQDAASGTAGTLGIPVRG